VVGRDAGEVLVISQFLSFIGRLWGFWIHIEDPRFPDEIAKGSSFGPSYSTQVVRKFSGREQRNQRWSNALRKGDVGHDIQDQTQYNTLLDFFNVTEGETNVFRFKDWTDFDVSSARGRLGDLGVNSASAIGHGKPDYQLYKRYTNSANLTQNPKDRVVSKPVSAQVAVYRNGSLVAFGSSAGQILCDTTTGKITFTPDSTYNITSISKTNPAVAMSSGNALSSGHVIYIRGAVTMTQVNSLSFTVVSATTSSYILSGIDATSYGTYGGSGITERYPQSSESLHWVGQFDTPCRFDTDHMSGVMHLLNNESWPRIPIIEVRT